ncbi:MAG: hypothetical protein AABX03_01435, partial [Nanoarchaeota archaeon]
MIKIAVQLNYLAKKGWKPKNADEDYLITLIKIEFSESAIKEAKYSHISKDKNKNLRKLFEEAAASVAAESSTGTWT